MLLVVAMCALRAVEEVGCFGLFGFSGGGVGVRVGNFGCFAVGGGVEGVVVGDDGGEGGC